MNNKSTQFRARANSVTSIAELNKRKRENRDSLEPEDITKIFQRSKVTSRSPDKTQYKTKVTDLINLQDKKPDNMTNESDMNVLKVLMANMMAEIKDEMKKNKDEIKEELQKNNTNIQNLQAELKEKEEKWKKEKDELIQRIEQLEENSEKKDKKERKNNIVIKGVTIRDANLTEGVANFIKRELNITPTINTVSKLGNNASKEVLIVQLSSWTCKTDIMKNKFKLNGQQIYIENDLTEDERKIQAEIRSKAREEKIKGNRIKIGYQKLTINDQYFEWNKKKRMLELTKRKEITSQSKN